MPETSDNLTGEKRKISKAEINELPLIAWEGEIRILETSEEMVAAAAVLANESHLGFDTETRPSFKKSDYYPPALIQLATENCVYLFRISKAAQVSNWARPKLDNKQVRYAATDAWISREIYRQAVAERDS